MVANKVDVPSDMKAVSSIEGRELANEVERNFLEEESSFLKFPRFQVLFCQFVETSARDDSNVDLAFVKLIADIIDNYGDLNNGDDSASNLGVSGAASRAVSAKSGPFSISRPGTSMTNGAANGSGEKEGIRKFCCF